MNKQYVKRGKKKKPISAEVIARMADRGEDISRFFTGHGMIVPNETVQVDFTGETLERLDSEAARLKISRQAVIKSLVREGLDKRYPRRPRGVTRAQKAHGQRQ